MVKYEPKASLQASSMSYEKKTAITEKIKPFVVLPVVNKIKEAVGRRQLTRYADINAAPWWWGELTALGRLRRLCRTLV